MDRLNKVLKTCILVELLKKNTTYHISNQCNPFFIKFLFMPYNHNVICQQQSNKITPS